MPRPRDSRLPYMPGIDALRAIAVLAVFFYHVGAGWMPGGFLGVDVFFVISGYLITAWMALFGRKKLLMGVLSGTALSTLLMIGLFDPFNTNRDFYGTDTRAVGLLIGVALALVWHPNDLRKGGRRVSWWFDAAGIVALAFILHDF